MKEQLVSFKTAELAQENNFRIPTYYFYSGDNKEVYTYGFFEDWFESQFDEHNETRFNAPTQALLQRWLREVHKINVESNYFPNIEKYKTLYVPMDLKKPKDYESLDTCYASRKGYLGKARHNSYEEALEEGLQGALKLI